MNRILFVDDDNRLLAGLRRTFHRSQPDWDCAFAETAEEALVEMGKTPANVLVTDMAMARMSGLDLALRVRDEWPQTATIILTGTADLGVAVNAINEARVFRFYTKPCPAPRLAEGIADALMEQERQRAARPTQQNEIGLAALKLLPLGVFVVDSDAHIEFMNSRAATLVARQDGLRIDQAGILRAMNSEMTTALHHVIQLAANGKNDAVPDTALFLRRPSGEKDLTAMISTIKSRQEHNDLSQAMIFITDPEAPIEPNERILRELFGFTHAEARLVRALIVDNDLSSAAERSNITLQTARSYLKRIFEKTETSQQSQLIKLVLTSPAVLDTE